MIQRGIATFTLDYGKCPKWLFERIPSTPIVPIENYLLKLKDDAFDAKESSVYLVGVENLIKSIWTELTKLYPRSLYYDKLIHEKLGIHPKGFYAYKNGKKAISVQMLYALLLAWKEYCYKTDSDLKEKWDEIYRSKIYFTSKRRKPITLPRYFNPKLSYLIGWICGDGNLTRCGNHYMVKISEKLVNQLEFVLRPVFKDLFNVEPPIYHIYKGGYALQFNSKPLSANNLSIKKDVSF